MAYLTVVNFIDVCSDSMLYAIDQMPNCIINDGDILVEIDREFSKCFTEKALELIKQHRTYGSRCMLVSTCSTATNWRKNACRSNSQLSISNSMVSVTATIQVESQKKLDKLVKAVYNKCIIQNKENVIGVEHENIDSIDLTLILHQLIPHGVNFINGKFYILEDVNAQYTHDGFIPTGLLLDIELFLRSQNIIN